MASAAKKIDPKNSSKEHAFFGHTRDLLSEVWDTWIGQLGHTPASAKKVISAKIKEFHKAETKSAKSKPKKKVKSVKRKTAKTKKRAAK